MPGNKPGQKYTSRLFWRNPCSSSLLSHVIYSCYIIWNNHLFLKRFLTETYLVFLRCNALLMLWKYGNSLVILLHCFINCSPISGSFNIFNNGPHQGNSWWPDIDPQSSFFKQFSDKRWYINLSKHLKCGVVFCCFSTVCFQCWQAQQNFSKSIWLLLVTISHIFLKNRRNLRLKISNFRFIHHFRTIWK